MARPQLVQLERVDLCAGSRKTVPKAPRKRRPSRSSKPGEHRIACCTHFEYDRTCYEYTRACRSRADPLPEDPPPTPRLAVHSHGRVVLRPGARPCQRSSRGISLSGARGACRRRNRPSIGSRKPGLLPGRRKLSDIRRAQEHLLEDGGPGRSAPRSACRAREAHRRRGHLRIRRPRLSSGTERRGPSYRGQYLLRGSCLHACLGAEAHRAGDQPFGVFSRGISIPPEIEKSFPLAARKEPASIRDRSAG
jgi:hypothetical protein